jgi:hypothetical protein
VAPIKGLRSPIRFGHEEDEVAGPGLPRIALGAREKLRANST